MKEAVVGRDAGRSGIAPAPEPQLSLNDRRPAAPRFPASEHGVALLITLVFVVLASFLILGLIANMRLEREIAYSYGEDAQVQFAADLALAEAISCLTSATAPASANEILATAPGVVYRISGSVIVTQRLWNISNTSDKLVDIGQTANNLNFTGWICGANSLYPTPSQSTPVDFTSLTNRVSNYLTNNTFITPGWTALGTNAQPPISATFTSPASIRYAFWIDAESCKVNLESARTRSAADLYASSVTNIDIRALEGIFFNTTNSALLSAFFSHPYRPFVTLEQMRLPNGAWPAQTSGSFESNKFLTTIYGSTNNLDVFNRERPNLNLLTNTAAPTYATALARLQETRYGDVVYPGIITSGRRSFAEKYGSLGVRQILANIIEYQRNGSDNPILSGFAATDTPTTSNYMIPSDYAGLKQGPLIEQVLLHASTNSVSPSNIVVDVHLNLKLVNGYNVSRGSGYEVRAIPASLAVEYRVTGETTNRVHNETFTTEAIATLVSPMPAHTHGSLSQLIAGAPPKFTASIQSPDGSSLAVEAVTFALKRVRLLMNPADNASILDWMTQADFNQAFPSSMVFTGDYLVASSTLAGNFANPASAVWRPLALGKHDPRVRTFPGWSAAGALANGSVQNLQINWAAYAYTGINPTGADTCSTNFNASLSPTTYSLLADVRPPSNAYLQQTIRETPMTSIGELAEIHTGYPWRCLRLASVIPFTTNQIFATDSSGTNLATAADTRLADLPHDDPSPVRDPNSNPLIERNAAPDWLLLDMFTAGTDTQPGRINLNQQFTGPARGLDPRTPSLEALLLNTFTNLNRNTGSLTFQILPSGLGVQTTPALEWLTDSIANRRCVTVSPYAALPIFSTPGQVCEVVGINLRPATAGSTTNDRFERGAILRRIGNLITTRSDVFSIFVVAEAMDDLDRDGRFDWVYLAEWRYLPETNPNPADIPDSWWQSNVVDTVRLIRSVESGDGDDTFSADRLRGRIALQAVVERYFEGGVPKYRILYSRYLRG